jgi:SAM-dependent methyltransferase
VTGARHVAEVEVIEIGERATAQDIRPASAWPAADLDYLDACPCCGSRSRRVQIDGLRDFTMGVAAGEWTMWRCGRCRCAYLDPRPTSASLGRAYAGYHTHAGGSGGRLAQAWTLARRAKFHLERGVARAPTPLAAYGVRHLAAARPGERLLDVGFGAGGFLDVASWLGYRVTGVDFDPEVVANARARGFEVRQAGVPGSGLQDGQFAHVTLSNVLEHLVEPAGALGEIWRLLQPGGRLWLTQPNLAAPGVQRFGRFWRGYEAPRHLTLWEPWDLVALLERCGFVAVRLLPPDPTAHDLYYRESQLQRGGFRPGAAPPSEVAAAAEAAAAVPRAITPEAGESLTLVAYRPS